MKALLLLMLCLPACTVITGNATKGTYSYASVGGNVSNYAQTPNGMTAASISNEGSFRELNKTARMGIGAAAAVGIAKDLSSSWTSTTNAKTAADVSKSAGAEATKQAAIAAETEAARIAAEAALIP